MYKNTPYKELSQNTKTRNVWKSKNEKWHSGKITDQLKNLGSHPRPKTLLITEYYCKIIEKLCL